MRKLLLVASSALCALMPFKATFAESHVSVYAGIGAGVNILSVKRTATLAPFVNSEFPPVPPLPLNQIRSADDHGSSGVGLAFIGAKYQYNYFALAAELTGVFGSTSADEKTINFLNGPPTISPVLSIGIRERMKNSFYLSLLPGFYINHNTEIFGRVGYAEGNFEVESTEFGGGGNLGITGNRSKSVSGYVVGLGVQTKATHSLDLRLEYDYAHYGKITTVTPQSVLGPLFSFGDLSASYRPTTSLIAATLIYHYDFA